MALTLKAEDQQVDCNDTSGSGGVLVVDRQSNGQRSSAPIEKPVEINESRLSLLGALSLFASLGVVVRIGLNQLYNFAGTPVPFIIYAQFLGCFFMGFFNHQKTTITLFSHSTYVGLTTGFCGSLTTFSSLLNAANQQLFNVSGAERNFFQSILAYFSVLLAGFSVSFSGYFFGKHLGATLPCGGSGSKLKYAQPSFCIPKRATPSNVRGCSLMKFAYALEVCYIVMAILLLIMLILFATFSVGQLQVVMSAIFGPIGAVLRWYFGFLCNKKYPNFFLGTFLVNLCGSQLLGVLFVLSKSLPSNTTLTCTVLSALSDGFCGGLTTISSFVAEMFILKRRYAYRYFCLTMLSAQVGLTLIFLLYTLLVAPTATSSCL